MHLIQPGVTYSGCGQFTKKKNTYSEKQEIQDIFIKTH